MRVLLRGAVVMMWSCVLAVVLRAAGPSADVSRTPPAIYERELQGMLTPVEKALAGKTALPDEKTGGVTLLNETISYRGEDGLTYTVWHGVYYALDESAVKHMGSDEYTFDRERESIFLVSAQTILPDGTRLPVDEKGAFIQTPQREADSAMYTSTAELNIIFPKVSPGAVTEAVVLVRENTSVIPGEFAISRTFGSGWPCAQRRVVVDLPETLWSRIHLHTNVGGVPDPVVEKRDGARERRTWSRELIRHVSWEERAPELQFYAPTLWLTTLDNWDAVAKWFDGLVASRSDLGDELTAQVDRWTEGLKDPQAILAILHEKVAIDVRYTGLEFGLAGYQPYACRDVWAKRYGDCKDKANLLRSMLAHKGIRAHVVLLNTTTLGRIERASPSWTQFDHAITAVDDGKGGYIFCDPTMKFLPAGVLPISDLNRDVLVVRGEKAEWIRTPDQLSAGVNLQIDASLSESGELSGWFNIEATGSDAANYASFYAEKDHEDLVRAMHDYVDGFLPGAEIMDTEFVTPKGSVTVTKLRTFFIRHSRSASADSLNFPFPASWLPDLDTVGERKRPYFTSRRVYSLRCDIKLPDGWTASSLPSAFSAPSEIARFAADWKISNGKLAAQLTWYPERAEVQAKDYVILQKSVRALKAWLEHPVVLARAQVAADAAAPAPAKDAGPELANFPVMPTGSGQLKLLDERFPEGEKNPERKAALDRVLQWFPDDVETVFEAKVKLALIDWSAQGDKEFARSMAEVLRQHGSRVSHTLRGWGEYLEAKARWGASKDPKAIEKLRELAKNELMPPYRRGWCAYTAGQFLAEAQPRKAVEFLEPFGAFKSDAQDEAVALLLKLELTTKGADGLEKWLSALVSQLGAGADETLSPAIEQFSSDFESLPQETRSAAVNTLVRITKSEDQFPNAYPRVKKLVAKTQEGDLRRAFSREVSAYLQKHPTAWYTKEKDKRLKTPEAAIQRIKERNDATDAKGTLDAVSQLWLYHQPSSDDFAKYTNWAMWWLDSSKLDDGFLDLIAESIAKFPPESAEEIINCWSTYADHLVHRGNLAKARNWHERIAQCDAAKKYQRVEALGELGKIALQQDNVDEALAYFRRLEPEHTAHRKGVDYLFISLLVTLERGDYGRGLEIISHLKEQEEKYLHEAKYAVPIGHVLRNGQNPTALRAYWQRSKEWRPKWNAILADAKLPVPPISKPPLDVNYAALNEKIAAAIANRDSTALIQNLDTYVRLAQWIPLFVNDFGNVVVETNKLSQQTWRSLAECLYAMVSDVQPVDPQFDAQAKVWECAYLADLGRPAESVQKAKALYQTAGPKEAAGQSAARVWLASAQSDADRQDASAALRDMLEGSITIVDRSLTVAMYSDYLMARPEKNAEHVQFLDLETGRKDFSSTTERGKLLVARLKDLRTRTASASALTKDISDWIKQCGIGWLDKVAPLSLEDPRFASLKGPLPVGHAGFVTSEVCKYDLLLALNEALPPNQREQAFSTVVMALAWSTGEPERFAQTYLSAAALASLSDGQRASLLALGAMLLLDGGHLEEAAKLDKAISPGSYSADRRESLKACLEAARLMEARNAQWAEKSFTLLTRGPVDYVRARTLERFFAKLGYLGENQLAEQCFNGTDKLILDPALEGTLANHRLQWARSLRTAKASAVVLDWLQERVSSFPEVKAAASIKLPQVIDPVEIPACSDEEFFALFLDRLRQRELGYRGGSGLLRLYNRAHFVRAAHPEFGVEFMRFVLGAELDDQTRVAWLMPAFATCDFDLPNVRVELEPLLQQFVNRSDAKTAALSRQFTVYYLGRIYNRAYTDGRPTSVFQQFKTLNVPADKATSVQLEYHVSRGNDAEALALLDVVPPNALLAPGVFSAARRIYARSGRDMELKMLDTNAAEIVRQNVSEAWIAPIEAEHAIVAATTAAELGQRELITDEWVSFVRPHLKNPMLRSRFDLHVARLRGDWRDLKAAADSVITLVPDMYSTYFDRASASHHLGDDENARKDLSVFLGWCLDDERYQDAVALWKTLSPGEPVKVLHKPL